MNEGAVQFVRDVRGSSVVGDDAMWDGMEKSVGDGGFDALSWTEWLVLKGAVAKAGDRSAAGTKAANARWAKTRGGDGPLSRGDKDKAPARPQPRAAAAVATPPTPPNGPPKDLSVKGQRDTKAADAASAKASESRSSDDHRAAARSHAVAQESNGGASDSLKRGADSAYKAGDSAEGNRLFNAGADHQQIASRHQKLAAFHTRQAAGIMETDGAGMRQGSGGPIGSTDKNPWGNTPPNP
jgi:hypothetical protein